MKKVINPILAICALAMLFICWRSIRDTQEFDKEVEAREAVVKARLMEIRSAQEAFKTRNGGVYCPGWSMLINFVKTDSLPMILKQGELTDDQMDKGMTETKATEILRSGDAKAIAEAGLQNFRRDTVWVSVMDSLFSYEGFNVDSLRYIPFAKGDTFELIAIPNTTRSGTIIQVMECNASDTSFLKDMGKMGARLIYNRREDAEARGAYAGLKIGEAGNNWNNNAGNWE